MIRLRNRGPGTAQYFHTLSVQTNSSRNKRGGDGSPLIPCTCTCFCSIYRSRSPKSRSRFFSIFPKHQSDINNMTFRSVFVRDKGAEMYFTAKPFRKETNSMSIQIKPGYTNPLATMKQNKPKSKLSNIHKSGGNSDKVTSLQSRRQQLQNEMLLIKAVGADAGKNTEKLKNMEEKLTEISNDLRTARADSSASSSPSLRERLLYGSSRSWQA